MKARYIFAAIAAAALMATVTSCGLEEFYEDDNTVAIVDGNTLTYGSHQYTFVETETSGTLTFTNFPSTVREFTALHDRFLGNSQPGVLCLDLLAFEMFRRDRTKGQRCIEMCNLAPNAKAIISNLSQKFPEKREDINPTDSYQQPYLVAAYLGGAREQNDYQPDYPYTITFNKSQNADAKQGEYSYINYGKIYTWVILRGGWRDVSATVLVPDYEDYVLVNECPGLYSGVPGIDSWKDTLK